MRQIKFRAWDGEKMMFRELHDRNWYMDSRSGKLIKGTHPSDRGMNVMEFTGLLDKTGVEIYEGDIINMGDNQEWFSPRVVEFRNGSWMCGGCRIYTNQDKHDYQGSSNQGDWEVVGNIYENTGLTT